jgi:hypothetical protein
VKVRLAMLLWLPLMACAGGTERAERTGGAGASSGELETMQLETMQLETMQLETVQRQLVATERRLLAAIGPASCTTVSQCNVVAVGHKACGGPAGHLPYSTVATDVGQVQAVAAEHRALAQRANTLRGAMSDCMLVEPPPLACVAGRCTAQR